MICKKCCSILIRTLIADVFPGTSEQSAPTTTTHTHTHTERFVDKYNVAYTAKTRLIAVYLRHNVKTLSLICFTLAHFSDHQHTFY